MLLKPLSNELTSAITDSGVGEVWRMFLHYFDQVP